MDTQTIRQIGPHQILNEIGRGAMGVVYRAFDPHIGRELAIKTLYVPQLADENQINEARQRFTLEAQAAGRLSHPNIVVIYQFGQERDYQYLAMELIPGASLDKLMAERETWTPAEVSSIIGQTAAALDFAHANQVIHRDVKPGNIMVRPDGVVKVTDFGIARVSEQILTQAGTWGTPVYMAPERINGERGDARGDQYALAVMAYQLLANKLPFGKTGDVALLYEILHQQPAQLSDGRINNVIQRGLAKNPDQRFPSCADFARELDIAIGAVPELPTIRTLPPPPLAAPRKSHAWIWLLVVLLIVGASAGYFFYSRTQTPRPTISQPAQRPIPYTAPKPEPVLKPPVLVDSSVQPHRGGLFGMGKAKGAVRLIATIDAKGRVEKLEFVSGPDKLVQEAEKTAMQWIFDPATLDGQPVEGTIPITVEFGKP